MRQDVNEKTPLLQNNTPTSESDALKASPASAIVNLVISLMDGSLALIPGAFACKLVGIIPYLLIQTMVASLQAISATLLTASIQPKKPMSYQEIVATSIRDLTGIQRPMFISNYVKAIIILGTWGTIIGCWQCMCDVFVDTFTQLGFGDTILGSRAFVMMIFSALLYAVCTPTDMNSIAITSQLSLFGVIVMLILSIVNSVLGINFDGIQLFGTLEGLPQALGICIFMYIWHFNHIGIYDSLQKKSDMNFVIYSGSSLAYCIIVFFSLLIYISFDVNVESDALINFDKPSDGLHLSFIWATILRVCAALAAMLSIPCFVLECKANLYQCFWSDPIMPTKINLTLTFLIVFLAAYVAAVVNDVGYVLSVIGCVCGSQLVFVFPATCFFRFGYSNDSFLRTISIFIFAFGLASLSLLYFSV